VFHAALKNGVDLHVSDTLDPKIQGDIPAWYRKISSAGSFLIFPLMVAGKPLGLIYADHPMPNGVGISEGELNLLKALRNQIVLAFRSSTSNAK
jgi:GAF domain-containing protein